MRLTLTLLCAALAAAAPNPRPQDDPSAPNTTTVVNTTLPIPIPTLPSGNVSLPANLTTPAPTIPITSVATLPTDILSLTSRSKTRKPHTEPVPIFTSNCGCPSLATMAYPCYAYDALNRCVFEENHSRGCHFANRGCPSPTRTCGDLFKPTPPTGKHPCDLSPPENTSEPETSAAPAITAEPTLA